MQKETQTTIKEDISEITTNKDISELTNRLNETFSFQNSSYINVEQCAKLLQISERTVRRRINSGKIEAIMTDTPHGKKYLINKEQFNQAHQIMESITIKKEYELKEFTLFLTKEMQRRENIYTSKINELEEKIEQFSTICKELEESNKEQAINFKKNISDLVNLTTNQTSEIKTLEEQIEQLSKQREPFSVKLKRWFKLK